MRSSRLEMFRNILQKLFSGSPRAPSDSQDTQETTTGSHISVHDRTLHPSHYSQLSARSQMPQVSGQAQVSINKSEQAPQVKKERVEGSIRKLLASYGFIAGDDGIDYFLHWSGMSSASLDFRKLHLQMRVSFLPVLGSDRHGVRSWRAVSTMVLDEDL